MLLKNYNFPPDFLVEYWKEQAIKSSDRNKDWFPSLLKGSRYKYKLYTVITDNDNIVSFSAIQTQNFPVYTCRIGTRSYIDPRYRNYTSSLETEKQTPIFKMLKAQYCWVKENIKKENCFASIEYGKTAALHASAKKFQKSGIDAKVLPHLYKMFPDTADTRCYQSVMLFPIMTSMFDLDYKERK